MKQYLRILSYLRPYKGLFCLSLLAMIAFGALDAFSFTLLIPCLDVLFQEDGGAGSPPGGALFGPGADDYVHRLREWTVGGLIPADSPMEGSPPESAPRPSIRGAGARSRRRRARRAPHRAGTRPRRPPGRERPGTG